jgi:cyclic pyranopterin phosphate synthase
MPPGGIKNIGHTNILTFEEIVRLVKIAASLGVSKVRLTGGEPLVRKGIEKLIAQIARIPLIKDIALTTNGMLFADMAQKLKDNGLTRVNFSLDSLDAAKFNYITDGGDLDLVFASIEKAVELKMSPVKINVVIMKGFNDNEILDFVKLADDIPINVRFIEFMPVGDLPFFTAERILSINDVRRIIESEYELLEIPSIKGSGPAKYFKTKNATGTVGFIGTMSEYICQNCNRIRLTADGKLRGCLYVGEEVNLKTALRDNKHVFDDSEIAELFRKAAEKKPRRHEMNEGWGKNNERKMSQIGG